MRPHLALVAAVLGIAGCGREAVPPGGVRVSGRLVDDETGKEVSRSGFWVHAFSDSVKAQVTLSSDSESSFSLVLPARDVRLRVADDSNTYALYERRFTATSDAISVEVRLVPTHYIRLHGRVLQWRAGRLAPIPHSSELGRTPFVSVGPAGLRPDEEGAYSVRVPRSLHEISTLNTGDAHTPARVDLRGVTEPDRSLDVILGKP